MPEIEFSRQAADFLTKIPARHAGQIARKIAGFADIPDGLLVKELKGYPGLMRLKSGEYRIVFRMDETIMRVMLIERRNDDEIYKVLDRLMKHHEGT